MKKITRRDFLKGSAAGIVTTAFSVSPVLKALAESSSDEVREFEFFGCIWDPYQESTPIYDALQEATGITVNFTWSSTDAYSTLLAARVADGDIPDVIGYGVGDSTLLNSLIDDGLIIPLTDLLDEYLPNYSRLITDDDYLYLVNQNDGEVYAFGMVMDVPSSYSYMIRQDWLDNLGLDVPETWDEWVEVWTAFKEQDPNGNGSSTDEIPFGCYYSYLYFTENIFGIETNGTYSIVDGHYIYDPEHPRYEEWLDAMRSLYENGLISQEYMDITSDQLESLAASDELGSAVSFAVLATDGALAAQEINEDAYYVCTPPIVGPYGDQKIRSRGKLTLNTYITQAAIDHGCLDAILEFFDFIFSDEGILITNYGIEGESYEMVDGEPKLLDPYNSSFTVAREYGIIPTPIAFCFQADTYNQILYGGLEYDELDKYSQAAADGLGSLNEPYYYTVPFSVSTDATVEYADLITEQKSLRDQYIMGLIDKDTYNSSYESLKAAGLNELIESVDEAYQNVIASVGQ